MFLLFRFLKSDCHRLGQFPVLSSPSTANLKALLTIHYFDYNLPDNSHIYSVWGLTARVLMLTACMAFQRLPEFVTPGQLEPTKDPLFLGYMPLEKSSKL